jgi:hypothetical protein
MPKGFGAPAITREQAEVIDTSLCHLPPSEGGLVCS